MASKTGKSALKVNKGVEQPPAVNKTAVDKFKSKRVSLADNKIYIDGILHHDRAILAKAITLAESALTSHRKKAEQILEACLPYSGKSIRIGITGVPGVGKSTFIEAFGKHLTAQGHRVAILAIDPSSARSKGSILGDKTRMETLSSDPNAFIRPSPSSGSLGGVAQKTYESIILCEAAGFDVILVETVGVGQSETEAHSMVDFFLLLMLAGAGDELQGIKRGIIEMSDAIIINKADGNNLEAANRAIANYKNALHLFPPAPSGWNPRTDKCSSLTGEGIKEVWDMIKEYIQFAQKNGYFEKNRKSQKIKIFHKTIRERLLEDFYGETHNKKKLKKLEERIIRNEINSYSAAGEALDS